MSNIKTIGDLIAELQKMDPEIKVGLLDYGSDCLGEIERLTRHVTGHYDFIDGPPGTEVLVIG